ELNTLDDTCEHIKINKEDVLASVPEEKVATSQKTPLAVNQAQDGVEVIKMSAMRKAISRGMTQSYFTAPTFTLNYDIDMTNLIALRQQLLEPRSEERRVGKECISRWLQYR